MKHFYENVEGFLTKDHPEFFNTMFEHLPNKGVWVEVGSWMGKSISYCTVESVRRGMDYKFHCVDTWKGSAEHQDHKLVKRNQLFETFKNNTWGVQNMITCHQMESVTAAGNFENESVDAIFIDASHDYENVLADITAWYPKIKRGGIIGYDDHTTGMVGVRKAVKEFHEKNGMPYPPAQIGRGAWVKKP